MFWALKTKVFIRVWKLIRLGVKNIFWLRSAKTISERIFVFCSLTPAFDTDVWCKGSNPWNITRQGSNPPFESTHQSSRARTGLFEALLDPCHPRREPPQGVPSRVLFDVESIAPIYFVIRERSQKIECDCRLMNRKTLCSTRKMTREGLNWELWVQKWTLEGSLTTFFSFTGTHGTRAVFTFRRIKKYQYVEKDKTDLEHTNINHENEQS